ncbi:MAG TPA: hypothetical protein VKK79_07920 [Candidatus Lokiarchaeia archaeon]|nr:hypothetical protein [Candidatus Lokiarchaeia archaeon]
MVPYPEDDDENPIDEEEEDLPAPKPIPKPAVKPLGVKPGPYPSVKPAVNPVVKPVPTRFPLTGPESAEKTAPPKMTEPEVIPKEGQEISFTHRQSVVGKTLYFILVICIILIVGAAAWTISDLLQPTGKLTGFLELPFGAQLAILGAGLFVLFLLLITFYTLYKRGANAITRLLFTSKRMYQEMQVKTLAKWMTGGLMVAILLVTAGLVSLAVQIAAFGTSNALISGFLKELSNGEFVLMIGLFALGFTGMAIAFEWLWNVGNIFFARKFLKA